MNDQQKKSNKNLMAIASLICGVISVLPVIACLISLFLALVVPDFMYYDAIQGQSMLVLYTTLGLIYFSPISFVISIAGLIFGKIGLNSTKRNFAVIGITLSLINLISLGIMGIQYLNF